MPAAGRQLQTARRDQPAAAARRGRAARAASSPSRPAIMPRPCAGGEARSASPRRSSMPARCPVGEGRSDGRGGGRDRLLRPRHREPRGDRRAAGGQPRRDLRYPAFNDVDVIEGQGTVGVEIAAQRRLAAAGDRAVRRRRARRPGSRSLCRSRSPPARAGTTWPARSPAARRARRGARAADPLRRAPDQAGFAAHLRCAAATPARAASRSARRRWRRRCASPSTTFISSPSPAGGRRWPLCSPASGHAPADIVIVLSGGSRSDALRRRYRAP